MPDPTNELDKWEAISAEAEGLAARYNLGMDVAIGYVVLQHLVDAVIGLSGQIDVGEEDESKPWSPS